jgi:transposase
MGRARHLGAHLLSARGPRWRCRTADDRLDDRQSTPLGRRRKRGARAHAIGRSKGGRTTKIHAVTDEKGRPVVLCVTPGNTSDYTPAKECIEAVEPARHLIADKGYDSAELRGWLQERGTEPVIPPRSNRKVQYRYDAKLYRERNRIERSFCRLKDYRRIATRFDRNVKNFMAALCIAATVIWWC